MKLVPTAFVHRQSRVWLAFCSRMFCVLLLCSSFLSMHTDYRVHALSPVERGMSDAPVSKGADNLCCGVLQAGDDIILPSGIDNDPFLFFLTLRAAFISGQSLFAQSDHFPSDRRASRVWASPLDAGPPHLYSLAKSVQLLC